MCIAPVDLEPPCPPDLWAESDCAIGQNTFTWNNPNHICCDDVILYRLYYTPVQGGNMELLATITNLSDTTYVYDNPSSVAGCFAVTAVDSFYNESALSNQMCIDNCPNYELPNVFTPNGDGINDLFIPFPYRYVKDIEITVYDRWGLPVFETTNPDINWNGRNQFTKKPCMDGAYFYVCQVNEIRVKGIIPRTLTGHIQLFRNK
jgi:gliding motility-associated-like protein